MKLRILLLLFAFCTCVSYAAVAERPAVQKPLPKSLPIEDKSNVSLAYIWLDIAEEATAQNVAALAVVPPTFGIAAERASAAPPAGPAVPLSQLITKDTGQVRVPDDPGLLIHRQPAPDFKPTAVYRWVDILLEASGRDSDRHQPRPPILSRTMAIVITAMYDAWAAYDERAVGTRLGAKLRRPAAERTVANKEKAIAYAAYRALLYVYPNEADWTRERFRKEGFDPDNDSTDPKTPEGVGNVAAHALIEFRRNDGSNQDGSMKGGDGTPYSDYTGYKPTNTADHFTDKTAWCPIPFSDGKGGWYSPGFLHPQCFKVTPFVLESTDQFRPGPPPQYGSEQLEREVEEVMQVNANLTTRAEGRRGIHARGPALYRTIRALASVRAGRVAARQPRPGPGHEAVLLGGERRLRRLHDLLGGQASLRHGPPLLVGAPLPRRRDRGRLAGSGQGLRED